MPLDMRDGLAGLSATLPPPATLDAKFAALRRREFSRLDRNGILYADYTGAALYPESLVANHARYLTQHVLGNPHSESGPSQTATDAMHEARRRTLALVGADAAEYEVVFTSNATGAVRILAEAFPFEARSRLVLSADNHNAVNGLRLAAESHHAKTAYVPLKRSLDSEDPRPYLRPARGASLFVFPAQSNFSGVLHPLGWIRHAREAGYLVLLDAAAYLPTNHLCLSETPADFVALSFYKIFGYPTGVGALVVKRNALQALRRAYFSGGSVEFVSVQNRVHRAKPGAQAFEDGTPDFLNFWAVCEGIEWFRCLGADQIGEHVGQLTLRFLAGLEAMGERVALYGPGAGERRGGTVSFNLRAGGRVLPAEDVEAAARAEGIALRSGCFCNPGAAEQALAIPTGRAQRCLAGADFSIPKFPACLGETPVGAVRASFGPANRLEDIESLLGFLERFAAGKS